MRVIILKVSEPKPSRHGGTYKRVIFVGVEDNKKYRLDVYDSHVNSRKWMPYLKLQAVFDRVDVFKDNIISGNSSFIYVGQRHHQKQENAKV